MAKYTRNVVGSVVKSKDAGKPDYINISKDVVLKKGQYLNLESKKFQLDNVAAAVAAGKLSAEKAENARASINKIPDFVRFSIVMVTKEG